LALRESRLINPLFSSARLTVQGRIALYNRPGPIKDRRCTSRRVPQRAAIELALPHQSALVISAFVVLTVPAHVDASDARHRLRCSTVGWWPV